MFYASQNYYQAIIKDTGKNNWALLWLPWIVWFQKYLKIKIKSI